MKNNKKYYIADALNEIRDEYIAEAAFPKKRLKRFNWQQMGVIAACFAIVIKAVTTACIELPCSCRSCNNSW